MERFVFHVTADNEFRIVDTSDDGKNYLFDDVDTILKLLNDAQATIAALQADNRTYINERHEHVKQIEQLQSQLTQRTAELEAAKAELNTVRRDAGLDCGDNSCLYAMNKTGMRTNGGCRCSPKRMKDDLGRSRKACDDLHAELERVRGERDKLAMCGHDHSTQWWQVRYEDLAALVAALPKVEGGWDILESKNVGETCWIAGDGSIFFDKAAASAYDKLLQHRQGMEG